MSYDVNTNGQTATVSSYEAAKRTVQTNAANFAASLAGTPARHLYRSPKYATRLHSDRLRSANKLLAGVKLPKAAGDVSGSLGGFSYAITRR